MKKLLLIILFTGILFGGGWWLSQHLIANAPANNEIEKVSSDLADKSNYDADQVYQNDDWGIRFQYPEGWEVQEGEILAKSSLFNLVLDTKEGKKLPRPIFLTVTSDEWGESVIAKVSAVNSLETTTVSSFETYKYASQDMGIPSIGYAVTVNDEYWILISGKRDYEEELALVLDTLEITPVEVDISSVGTLR